MSWAIEEMLNIVWCLAAVGADVEANILTDSALVGLVGVIDGSSRGVGGVGGELHAQFPIRRYFDVF